MIGRYETQAMAAIWNEEAKFERWTRVEVAACEVFHSRGEISDEDIAAIRDKAHHQSAERVAELEKTTHHDVVAFVQAVGESIGSDASRHIHRGLTSSDILDTASAIALVQSMDVMISAVQDLRSAVGEQAKAHKNTPCAGRTHGVHAEPTTFGLRLAGWYSELTRHLQRLEAAKENIGYGKLSGAVGSFSQTDPAFEAAVLEKLDLKAEAIATQVVPRDRHAEVLCALALLGGGLERFATEIRSLQRTDIREAEEPFRTGQTGSSAMPHKRNPIITERVTGMARLLRGYMVAASENIALWHDRDISHSSVERVIWPDAFHIAHYMLLKLQKTIEGMRVYPEAMAHNIERTGGLLFSQNALGVFLAKGLGRQEAYRLVQRNAMAVWEKEEANLLDALVKDDDAIKLWGSADAARAALAPAFDLQGYAKHIDALFERAGI